MKRRFALINNIAGYLKSLQNYGLTKLDVSSSSGTLTLDMSLANVFKCTLTENITTITITNPPASGIYGELELKLIQHASSAKTVVHASKYKFPSASDHVMSTGTGKKDRLHYMTTDGGTTYDVTFAKDFS